MEIYALEYTLKPIQRLNRLGAKPRQGVLLLNEAGGLCDYFPWEEFGDQGLDQLLTSIREGNTPSFVLENFKIDISNLPEISFLNHALFSADKNHPCVKIKFFNDFKRLERDMLSAKGKIRLDFNQGLSKKVIFDWLDGLGKNLLERIDFIEDPYLNHQEVFNRVPLAFDFNPIPVNQKVKVKVFKPCREVINLENAERVIYTNNMGHGLNQLISYGYLAENPQAYEDYHGIIMPKLYDNQIEFFKAQGDRFTIEKDRVKKFLKEIEVMPWKKLI